MANAIVEKIRKIGESLMDPQLAIEVFESGWLAQVVVNGEAEIQFVNRQAELLFGWSRKELYDQHVNILVPEIARGAHTNHLSTYFAEPRVRPMGEMLKLQARHKSGAEFAVQIYLVPIMWHDGLLVNATVRKI